jgi:hypothetical protein
MVGKRGTVTIQSPWKRGHAVRHQGTSGKIQSGSGAAFRADASFWAHTGLVGGRKAVSLRSFNDKDFFLAHAAYIKG